MKYPEAVTCNLGQNNVQAVFQMFRSFIRSVARVFCLANIFKHITLNCIGPTPNRNSAELSVFSHQRIYAPRSGSEENRHDNWKVTAITEFGETGQFEVSEPFHPVTFAMQYQRRENKEKCFGGQMEGRYRHRMNDADKSKIMYR